VSWLAKGRQYAAQYADEVDLAAFAIYEQAEDPRIRRNAIVWNTISVPIMMRHCFNDEPLAALIHAWAYAIQVEEFFEAGQGTDFFGPHQDIAVEASGRLEKALEDLARRRWRPWALLWPAGWAPRRP